MTVLAKQRREVGLSPSDLAERTVHRRAVEAVIWGMPAVNCELMYQAMVRAKGACNQIAYWSRLPDWKIQTLTPNPDVIYLTPFMNTAEVGPVVLEMDIHCGPKAPVGFEKNWIPTVPGKNWFAYFRFYNPTEAYFDRSWPLPDFEPV